jgi:acetyltransferase-like isoleucine patch superfamily enzyme
MSTPRDGWRGWVRRLLGINDLAALPEGEAVQRVAQRMLYTHRIFGDPARVTLGRDVVLNDALINTTSGRVTLHDYAFCGHGVSLLTGTHDITQKGFARHGAVPTDGRDIEIGEGVWISSHATVLGPCRIGDHAVIAAGSVVTGDVDAGWVYAGVPAKRVRPVSEGGVA